MGLEERRDVAPSVEAFWEHSEENTIHVFMRDTAVLEMVPLREHLRTNHTSKRADFVIGIF